MQIVEVDLRNQSDLIGECKYQGRCKHVLNSCLVTAACLQILMGCSVIRTKLVSTSVAAGESSCFFLSVDLRQRSRASGRRMELRGAARGGRCRGRGAARAGVGRPRAGEPC
jgi:hypothetical protein